MKGEERPEHMCGQVVNKIEITIFRKEIHADDMRKNDHFRVEFKRECLCQMLISLFI